MRWNKINILFNCLDILWSETNFIFHPLLSKLEVNKIEGKLWYWMKFIPSYFILFHYYFFFQNKIYIYIKLNNYTWIKGRRTTSCAAKPFYIVKPNLWKTTKIIHEIILIFIELFYPLIFRENLWFSKNLLNLRIKLRSNTSKNLLNFMQ
jgi:hypothetical protein